MYQKAKKKGVLFIFFNHNQFLGFRIFLYQTLRMILNYAIKYITKCYKICNKKTCFTCKHFHKLVFPLNTVYLYTASNLHINVLLLGQHVEKELSYWE